MRNSQTWTYLCRSLAGFAALILAAWMVSTPALSETAASLPPADKAVIPPAPDYDEASSWLARPDNPDAFAVDILWVYPTVLYDQSAWLMDITRKDLIAGAAETVHSEALVFSGQANLYAPFYRQMNLAGFNLPEDERDALTAHGEEDIRRALRHYMEHYNNGRPFIVAAHSQGSYVLTQLIVDHWGKLGIEAQLIAGYLIGWSITGEDLQDNPAIDICGEPRQTGCFISYNSVAAGKQGEAPMILKGAIVVNPLTWTRETKLAPSSLNLGSTLFDGENPWRTYPGFTSAQIADHGLVVAPADPALLETPFFPQGVYHSLDYSLFFENIKSNAAQRIQAHLARKNGPPPQ
ncbi:DUF3089 domain-containing protein [Roseibium salinum]|uniref:DUF3089 domain-containing protein n=1 Tax=Roseibium salinum TaxID=1604349 RepID=A0ABT3R8Z4_9HYPH|nr:DUF3089 domain-containing protein [Roseibium sp. DSM 29163]MCX2725784.1 DUF3089 domain-containing protein [Roseibium sp. DSM 29163]